MERESGGENGQENGVERRSERTVADDQACKPKMPQCDKQPTKKGQVPLSRCKDDDDDQCRNSIQHAHDYPENDRRRRMRFRLRQVHIRRLRISTSHLAKTRLSRIVRYFAGRILTPSIVNRKSSLATQEPA